MAISENIANLRWGIQSAQGSPEATSSYGAYLAGGSGVGVMRTDEDFEETTSLRMRSDRYVSEAHAGGTPELYAMPLSIGSLLYGVLGAKSVTGSSDPYTHEFTPASSRPWFTFWQNIGDLIFEESSDCKIDQLVISGSAGKPLHVAATVQGLTPRYQSAAETTATVEVTDRFLHYDGDGALDLEGTAVASIRDFTLTIANNGEIIPGDNLNGIDISEGQLTIQLAITKLLLTAAMRNELYYGSATPSNDDDAVSTIFELGGTPSVDFTFTRSATRTLQLEMPRVTLAPYDIQPGTGNSPYTEGIVLDVLQPSGSDAITATVLNAQATY